MIFAHVVELKVIRGSVLAELQWQQSISLRSNVECIHDIWRQPLSRMTWNSFCLLVLYKVTGKVILFLYLPWRHIGGRGRGRATFILNLGTRWGWVVSLTNEWASCTHCIGVWVGPKVSLCCLGKRKIIFFSLDSNPTFSSL